MARTTFIEQVSYECGSYYEVDKNSKPRLVRSAPCKLITQLRAALVKWHVRAIEDIFDDYDYLAETYGEDHPDTQSFRLELKAFVKKLTKMVKEK